MNALHIFPKELWELVAEKMETTDDIKNLMEAFPELSELSKGNEFSWLIEDIMPLIMSKFLTVKDIFSCRLVSKRWQNSVGTTLENHPDRLPYMSVKLTQITEEHFNYSTAPKITTHLDKFKKAVHPIEQTLDSSKNPFPSRVVSVVVKLTKMGTSNFSTNIHDDLPVLRDFGHHIWYLKVNFNVEEGSTEEKFIMDGLLPLLESLSFLPNLRSISFEGDMKNFNLPVNMLLPAVHLQLDSLDMLEFSMHLYVSDMLIPKLCSFGGIKKLSIHTRDWKKYFARYFPNLIELSFKSGNETETYDLLFDLRYCQSLRKLKIGVHNIDILRLFKRIRKSQWKLKSLEISAFYYSCPSCIGRFYFPSLESLKIDVIGADDFPFKAFPQLKYLTIWAPYRDYHDANGVSRSSSEDALLQFFILLTSKNDICEVFDELPNLKMITTTVQNGELTYQYVRECKGTVFKSLGRDFWTFEVNTNYF